MITSQIKLACAVALGLNFSVSTAQASDLGAAIVGGIIGGAIAGSVPKKTYKKTYTKSYSSSSGNSVVRQQNREMQSALNYFNFPAGSPDGVVGSKTRVAASQYQVFMGYPATGSLTQYERDFLVASYNRAQIGGPEVIKAMQGPNGVRGLLRTWRDEAAGVKTAGNSYGGLPIEVSEAIDEIAESSEPSAEQLLQRSGFLMLADLNNDGRNDYVIDTSVSGSSFWCGASHCAVMVFASTPNGYERNDFQAREVTTANFSCHQGLCRMNEPTTMMAADSAPAPAPTQPAAPPTTMASAPSSIPTFNVATPAAPEVSLASMCSKVALLTSSNGGFMTVSNMTDPNLALNEQFCLTRTYAISTGEQLVAKVQGATPAQIDAQCDAFEPVLAPFVASLAQEDSQAVRTKVQKFVLQSNMTLEQLATTAEICLFSGYRRDKMDIALGSALVMIGIGQVPYAELVGHHLSQGFGVPESGERARGWYQMAVSALSAGAEPVFAPGQPERVQVIEAAALELAPAPEQAVSASAPSGGLPAFQLK
ncbi:hypothetical protein LA6_001556 [Marinibacterium anthonyi]|nr:hypothetical protein LA6_001556 [Marinibacterium anthonyi]